MNMNEKWAEATERSREAAVKSTNSHTAEPRQAYALESIAWSLIAANHKDLSGVQRVQVVQ